MTTPPHRVDARGPEPDHGANARVRRARDLLASLGEPPTPAKVRIAVMVQTGEVMTLGAVRGRLERLD